jgi:hypothetical protein
MALNTVSSDRLSTNVKNTNFTAAEKQDLTDDILPLAGQLGNRNIIINGAMQVAQRGTSSTSSGYQTVDRFEYRFGGTDEAPTQTQADVASGTTPYSLGFRKSYKIQNGNQTSGAGSADNIYLRQRIEAQDIANSGWNYTSSSSFITLSFWVKSSVAQNFYGYAQTIDGTKQNYPFETGSLTADTWTKITKTIPGNSNLQFDNDVNNGLDLVVVAPFWGTDYTASSVTLNQWAAQNDSTRTPDNTSTWYTTNDATFEVTGVQLEVGSVTTDFEHRSFGQELALCQRYYQILASTDEDIIGTGYGKSNGHIFVGRPLLVEMRVKPSLDDQTSGSTRYRANANVNGNTGDAAALDSVVCNNKMLSIQFTGFSSLSDGTGAVVRKQGSGARFGVSAEL